MRDKQNQIHQQLKQEIKQKIHEKKADILSHIKKPLPAEKNKTSTYNPSYVQKQRQNFTHLKENLHLIINKASFMALRGEVKTTAFKSTESSEKTKPSSLNPKDMISNVVGKQIIEANFLKIMGCLPNQNSLSQLWALIPDQIHNGSFCIYNILTNLFLKVQADKVFLAPKQKSKDFLFQIIKETEKTQQLFTFEDSVVIKSMLNGKCLLLRGVLSLGDINTKSEAQQFYLKKINLYQPKKLKNTLILFNPQDKDKEKAFLSISKEKQEINYSQGLNLDAFPTLRILSLKNQLQSIIKLKMRKKLFIKIQNYKNLFIDRNEAKILIFIIKHIKILKHKMEKMFSIRVLRRESFKSEDQFQQT